MRQLKQSTARSVMIFMTDAADGKTGMTGLTLTCTLSKNGLAFASISPTVTERGNGWYSLALTASHTDTLGDLVLRATGAGADSAEVPMQVVTDVAAEVVASLGGADVTISSMVNNSGRVTIVCGDTYGASTGVYLNFNITGTLPDLSSATLRFTAAHTSVEGLTIEGTGELLSQDESEAVIRVSVTSTETANGRTAPGRSSWVYDVEADLGGGIKLTIVGPEAPCWVLLDQTT